MKQFEVTNTPIQTEQYREFVVDGTKGAAVVFTGHVREWTKGIKTEYLEYEAYVPMAEKCFIWSTLLSCSVISPP